MRKVVTMCLAILLVITLHPTPVNAISNNSITLDEAIELACNVFPEYEAEIKGQIFPYPQSLRKMNDSEFGTAIIEETRITDNGETVTYQQDENDTVIVTISYNHTLVDSSYGTGYAYRKCDLAMYCNLSDELLRVNGFEFTHVHNGYDSINGYGNTSNSTATIRLVIGNTRESSAMKAFVQYHVSFTLNKLGLNGELKAYLQAEVGNDSCTYSTHFEE